MNAFVLGGQERSALAVTRSLGRRGIPVLVGADEPVSLASASRYCTRHITYPSPERQPRAFQRFLLNFVRREHVGVVIPVTDVTTYLAAANAEALRHHCVVGAPPFEAFEAITDKWALLQRAQACGVPIPATVLIEGVSGLNEAVDRIQYPAVVKPTRSRMLSGGQWLRTSVHYAETADDVRRAYEETPYLRLHRCMIQERIDGPGVGLFGLFDRGRLLTAFAHRRLREKPPSGGVSVLCESVPVDPRLREHAENVLAPLGWHGVAMMEFKQDRRTGRTVLIEVNGRFWGSLQLAIRAGVDFPYLGYQLLLDRVADVPGSYRVGVRNRWLLGDVDHLLLRLFKGRRQLHLTDAAPSTLRAVIEFMDFSRRGQYYDTFSVDDPRPSLHELGCYAGSLSRSAARIVRQRVVRQRIAPTLAHS